MGINERGNVPARQNAHSFSNSGRHATGTGTTFLCRNLFVRGNKCSVKKWSGVGGWLALMLTAQFQDKPAVHLCFGVSLYIANNPQKTTQLFQMQFHKHPSGYVLKRGMHLTEASH